MHNGCSYGKEARIGEAFLKPKIKDKKPKTQIIMP